MDYSTNLKLRKPFQEDYYDVDDFNANADIIDEALTEVSGRGIVYEGETKTLSLSGGGTLGGGSSGGGSSGGGEGYILPVATKSRLGGVIIGEGISSEGDGRISPDYDSVVAKVAESYEAITEDDIKQAFEKEG